MHCKDRKKDTQVSFNRHTRWSTALNKSDRISATASSGPRKEITTAQRDHQPFFSTDSLLLQDSSELKFSTLQEPPQASFSFRLFCSWRSSLKPEWGNIQIDGFNCEMHAEKHEMMWQIPAAGDVALVEENSTDGWNPQECGQSLKQCEVAGWISKQQVKRKRRIWTISIEWRCLNLFCESGFLCWYFRRIRRWWFRASSFDRNPQGVADAGVAASVAVLASQLKPAIEEKFVMILLCVGRISRSDWIYED